MIGKSIYSLLNGRSQLTALVGTQIYPVQAPQSKKDPMVIYGIVKTEPTDDKLKVSDEDWVEADIVVYAKDYDLMHQIMKECRTALDGYSGTIAGNEISQIRFENYSDGWETSRESYSGVMQLMIIVTI